VVTGTVAFTAASAAEGAFAKADSVELAGDGGAETSDDNTAVAGDCITLTRGGTAFGTILLVLSFAFPAAEATGETILVVATTPQSVVSCRISLRSQTFAFNA
jgi:hypothetical protein